MKTVLVTGAGGSLGRVLTRRFADDGWIVRALDNHESSLATLKGDNVRRLLGDIRDPDRMDSALRGCDACVACASYKNLDVTEYNLEATFDTNISGTLQTAKACSRMGVKNAILISSDKAVDPVSAYGVSKLAQERVWLWSARTQKNTSYIIGRFGNFYGESAGSCFEVWDHQRRSNEKITVTDMNMERYFIRIDDVAACILRMTKSGKSGRIYIPKMKTKNIYRLAMEYTGCEAKDIVITGMREGEKIYEKLYSQQESTRIKDKGDYYVI